MINNYTAKVLSFLLISTAFSGCRQKKDPEILKTDTAAITYQIGAGVPRNWNVMPELNPDVLMVDCDSADTRVLFKTDLDSLAFIINKGDTVNFYVLLNDRDSALTQLIGQSKNVHFSDAYIEANKGKFLVEIPQVHELANIAVALSRIGRLDSNMTDMTTSYHREVLEHFGSFANHPLIDTINHHITGVMENSSYTYYYGLKMSACAYRFDENGAIVNEGIIRRMGFGGTDFVSGLKELFEDFAKKSDFNAFYQAHQNYYQDLITNYDRLNPVNKMEDWLEEKFNREYGSYRVIFSPLVGGAHATERFEDNGFTQTVMFVRRADPSPEFSKPVQEMLTSRVVFTEIDHNFVNPVTDGFRKQVDELLAERKIWVDDQRPGTAAYGTPYTVFNEYMTWAVFSLYCLDTFTEEENKLYQPLLTKQMEQSRGFIRFGDFNRKLIDIYRQDPGAAVNTWYRKIFEWMKDGAP